MDDRCMQLDIGMIMMPLMFPALNGCNDTLVSKCVLLRHDRTHDNNTITTKCVATKTTSIPRQPVASSTRYMRTQHFLLVVPLVPEDADAALKFPAPAPPPDESDECESTWSRPSTNSPSSTNNNVGLQQRSRNDPFFVSSVGSAPLSEPREEDETTFIEGDKQDLGDSNACRAGSPARRS